MRVVFRADSSTEIGTGHVSRCLALATELRDRGAVCSFVCRRVTEAQAATIRAAGMEVLEPNTASIGEWTQEADAAMTLRCAGTTGLDWVVVDHYSLASRWETSLRQVARKVAVIDDLADRNHDCDLLIDQNLHEDASSRYAHRIPAAAQALLGPRYALLRPEFRLARAATHPRTGAARSILVAFGGIDAADHTSVAVRALELLRLTGVHVDVVIGSAHAGKSRLADTCARLGFALHVQTTRMAALMSGADLAIGAGGVAVWERCAVGLPAVVLTVADNQSDQVRQVARRGVVCALSPSDVTPEALARHVGALLDDPQARAAMSRQAMDLVDGRGTFRVARAMGVSAVRMRPARSQDAANLFAWRNHPSIRRVSRSTDEIPWEGHLAWLDAVLAAADRVLLIGELQGQPVGVVRFDLRGDAAEVSIYMVPTEIAKGWGADLLLSAQQWLLDHRPEVRTLHAEVLGDNAASHRLFSNAGYSDATGHYTKRIR